MDRLTRSLTKLSFFHFQGSTENWHNYCSFHFLQVVLADKSRHNWPYITLKVSIRKTTTCTTNDKAHYIYSSSFLRQTDKKIAHASATQSTMTHSTGLLHVYYVHGLEVIHWPVPDTRWRTHQNTVNLCAWEYAVDKHVQGSPQQKLSSALFIHRKRNTIPKGEASDFNEIQSTDCPTDGVYLLDYCSMIWYAASLWHVKSNHSQT